MNIDYYQALIEERAKRPKYRGILSSPDVVVKKRDLLANDELALAVTFNPKTKEIVQVRWQGQGCTISRAVIETIASEIAGLKSLDKLKKLKLVDILKQLGLEVITPSRFKCADLGWQVFQGVLDKLVEVS